MIISHKLVTRYRELKQDVSDCILLMQVGAFMQVMGEDAQAVSDLTDLKLQRGGAVDAPMVIGGFPYTGLDKYHASANREKVLEHIIEANNNNILEREQTLLQLRQDLEQFFRLKFFHYPPKKL
jgi:DNA mismatch repair ATPase MutS